EIMGATANKIYVTMKGTMGMSADKIIVDPLFEDEEEALMRVPGVVSTGGFFYTTSKLQYNKIDGMAFIGVFNPNPQTTKVIEEIGYKVLYGDNLRSGDTREVVVGNYIPEVDFDGKKLEIGDIFYLNSQKVKITGIMEKIGNQQDDSIIWMSPETYEGIFKGKKYDSYSTMIVGIEDFNDLSIMEERIENALIRHRKLPKGKTDFSFMTSESITEQFNNIFSIIQVVVIGIAAISIIVGGVGIMNTMYTSVLERTKEIGIMKAIGAKNSHISTIFFLESGLLGFIGGLIGTIIGISLTYGIVQFVRVVLDSTYLVFVFDWYLIIGALFFSFLIGVLSGSIPAINAAKQNPVDSLRYE
ncbi:MAG: ABC transporter permease, partial [Candidatus Nanoarchaeia archaeon]|nr:ABC transporter permease [Candidatus Nanoarchaeia archaeon]